MAIGLSACAGAPVFPTDKLIEFDVENMACGQYRIVDLENFKFEYVMDIPCPSVFGFTIQDTPKVLNWMRDVKEYAKGRCQ